METKTKFTPSEAIASIEGMHRKKFYQMVSDGLISYDTERVGTKLVKRFDGSELIRVFGSKFKIMETRNPLRGRFTKQNETTEETHRNKLFEQEIRFLNERIAEQTKQLQEKDYIIQDVRQERDDWKQQAQKLLLTHKPIETPIETLETERKKDFLSWLFRWK